MRMVATVTMSRMAVKAGSEAPPPTLTFPPAAAAARRQQPAVLCCCSQMLFSIALSSTLPPHNTVLGALQFSLKLVSCASRLVQCTKRQRPLRQFQDLPSFDSRPVCHLQQNSREILPKKITSSAQNYLWRNEYWWGTIWVEWTLCPAAWVDLVLDWQWWKYKWRQNGACPGHHSGDFNSGEREKTLFERTTCVFFPSWRPSQSMNMSMRLKNFK